MLRERLECLDLARKLDRSHSCVQEQKVFVVPTPGRRPVSPLMVDAPTTVPGCSSTYLRAPVQNPRDTATARACAGAEQRGKVDA